MHMAQYDATWIGASIWHSVPRQKQENAGTPMPSLLCVPSYPRIYMKPWAVQYIRRPPVAVGYIYVVRGLYWNPNTIIQSYVRDGIAATFLQLPVMSCDFGSDSHPLVGARTHAFFTPHPNSISRRRGSS